MRLILLLLSGLGAPKLLHRLLPLRRDLAMHCASHTALAAPRVVASSLRLILAVGPFALAPNASVSPLGLLLLETLLRVLLVLRLLLRLLLVPWLRDLPLRQ